MAEIMMMPGFEGTLAPAIKEIGGAVDKYLNPHRDFQSAMQKALSTNPQLMQQLVDTEKMNPGTLTNLGFGKIADLLGSMEESSESEFARTNRAGIKQNRQLTLENEMAKNEGVKKDLEKAAKLIAQNTDLSMTAALKLIGQTPIDAKTDQLQLQAAEANLKIAEAQAGGAAGRAALSAKETANKMTMADFEADALRNAKVELPDGVTVDLRAEARNFLDGKLDGNRLAALITNPKTSAAFQANLNLLKSDRERDAQLLKEKRAREDRVDEVSETTKYNVAARMYEKHNGVADVPTWIKALNDPATIDIVERLRDNPDTAKPGEEKLLEIAQAMGQNVDLKKLKAANIVGQKIGIQFDLLEKAADGEERTERLRQMNALLKERSMLGGPDIQVTFEDTGFWDSGGYKYTDSKGSVYTKPEVQAIIENKLEGTGAALSPKAQEAIELITTHPAGVEATLQLFREKAGPNLVKEVEAALQARDISTARKKKVDSPKAAKRREVYGGRGG